MSIHHTREDGGGRLTHLVALNWSLGLRSEGGHVHLSSLSATVSTLDQEHDFFLRGERCEMDVSEDVISHLRHIHQVF